MRQDGRDTRSDVSTPQEGKPSEGWLGRFCGWIAYLKALETVPHDGASTQLNQQNLSSDRLTGKEAAMSQDQKQQLRVHIRWMIRRDMPEVLSIERESFEFPWFEEDFIRCLRQRNCIGMVAEQGERVVGFMIYELHKTRLHILNFAVAGGMRMRGIGRQMAEKLEGKLSSHAAPESHSKSVRPTSRHSCSSSRSALKPPMSCVLITKTLPRMPT